MWLQETKEPQGCVSSKSHPLETGGRVTQGFQDPVKKPRFQTGVHDDIMPLEATGQAFF